MSPRLLLLRLLPLSAGVVLLSACSSSEPGATRTAPPRSTRSTRPPTSPAPSASPASPASAAPASSAGAATAQSATTTIDYAVPDPVAAGAQVQVVHNDSEAHTLTIRSGPSVVVPPRGSTMTFTAPDKAGTHDIVCDFHGNMTAQLTSPDHAGHGQGTTSPSSATPGPRAAPSAAANDSPAR